ncbi:hypothetical protein L228DRAFT_24645 [Xylona heveae TC161]|uniref:Uncharacterized protein n=1 Tax=Xylona heveae (strain CBS 132557 / TC161) TaxID=1328760 RepID=A0A165ABR0_XYLHT|nr:hypothetical protein L228DRAFT_24645 [Xylona heveae TC161]KZF20223.1 hypothetical protein L228DRAFT_24645 [Xylona heveae TC161]
MAKVWEKLVEQEFKGETGQSAAQDTDTALDEYFGDETESETHTVMRDLRLVEQLTEDEAEKIGFPMSFFANFMHPCQSIKPSRTGTSSWEFAVLLVHRKKDEEHQKKDARFAKQLGAERLPERWHNLLQDTSFSNHCAELFRFAYGRSVDDVAADFLKDL